MARADFGWAIVRLGFGLSLAFFHGYAKLFHGGHAAVAGIVEKLGFPVPVAFGWAAGLAEFAGGLLLAVGLATRPAAIAIGITMGVALYHLRQEPIASSELALLYLAVVVMALLVGGGRFSLDRSLRLRLPLEPRS